MVPQKLLNAPKIEFPFPKPQNTLSPHTQPLAISQNIHILEVTTKINIQSQNFPPANPRLLKNISIIPIPRLENIKSFFLQLFYDNSQRAIHNIPFILLQIAHGKFGSWLKIWPHVSIQISLITNHKTFDSKQNWSLLFYQGEIIVWKPAVIFVGEPIIRFPDDWVIISVADV